LPRWLIAPPLPELRYVDIRDEASVPNLFASVAHRATAAELRYVDIRDEASVPNLVASTTYRVILGRIRTLNICDRAFVLMRAST